jgi:hypothetical protein
MQSGYVTLACECLVPEVSDCVTCSRIPMLLDILMILCLRMNGSQAMDSLLVLTNI